MRKICSILTIAACGALFASCDKEKDKVDNNTNTPKAKTKTELVTAGKWQVTAYFETYTLNGQKITDDYYKDEKPCSKDDFMLFGTDGKVSFDEGPTKCDPADDQVNTANWKFYDNETKIIFDEGSRPDTVNLVELTESVLKVTTVYTDDGVEFTLTRAFGRIN